MKASCIITLNRSDVKNENENTGSAFRHIRIKRKNVDTGNIDPAVKALARHVEKRSKKKKSVRIPAMTAAAFGQFLRSLEIRRAFI